MLPNFVYRIDSRPPDVIFREGFRSWGSNLSLLDHITGGSNLSLFSGGTRQPDDGFVSTSDTVTGSIRFLGNQMNNIQFPVDSVWLYEIRTTQNFYQLERSINWFYDSIILNEVNFEDPNDRTEAMYLLSTFANRIRYQNEWISVGDILPELIVSARRVDLRNYVNNLPTVTENLIENENYQQGPSNPNRLPFPAPSNIPAFVSDIQSNSMAFQNNGNGMLATGGFILFPPFSQGGKKGGNKKSISDKYPQLLFSSNKNLIFITRNQYKNTIENNDKFFYISQKWLMIDVKDNNYKYKLTNYNYQTIYMDWAYLTTKKDSSPNLIYDQYGRIGYLSTNGLIFYSLAVPNINTWDYLMFKPGLINDISMQWELKLSEDKKYLRMVSKKYPNLILGYNKGYLILQKSTIGYDEMAIDWKKLENKNILTKSFINNQYEWFDLRWVWKGVTYYPTINGGSYSSRGDQQIYLVREFGYILYVDLKTGNVYALTNKRENKDDWNWIKWEQIDRNEFVNLPTNIRRMWKIDYYNENKGICKINSYYQDDILWIQTHSTNWGSYFTSKKISDYSSKASIQHFANWKK